MPLSEFQQTTLQGYMQQPGCPLCRAIWNIDGRRFTWYVGDGVLDEETLRNVVRTLGFCPQHALSISILEGNEFLWSHLGSCMIYSTVIEQAFLPGVQRFLQRSERTHLPLLRQKVFSSFRHLFHRDLCPLCFDHRQHEKTYLERFVEAFSANQDFRLAYQQADSLCIPHFRYVQSMLSDQQLMGQLAEAETRGLEKLGQISFRTTPDWMRYGLSLLSGTDMFLWSDFLSRVALHPSKINPPLCPACQQSSDAAMQAATFLDFYESLSSSGRPGKRDELVLCPWHACWLYKQTERQPEMLSQLEPVLLRTCRQLSGRMRKGELEQGICHVCMWMNEQEIQQGKWLQRQLCEAEQEVPLCLAHTRTLLRQYSDEVTSSQVALALLRTVAPLGRRLNAYIHKCTEHLQYQMQPDERVAWFDAIQWFGGSEIAQFLLI